MCLQLLNEISFVRICRQNRLHPSRDAFLSTWWLHRGFLQNLTFHIVLLTMPDLFLTLRGASRATLCRCGTKLNLFRETGPSYSYWTCKLTRKPCFGNTSIVLRTSAFQGKKKRKVGTRKKVAQKSKNLLFMDLLQIASGKRSFSFFAFCVRRCDVTYQWPSKNTVKSHCLHLCLAGKGFSFYVCHQTKSSDFLPCSFHDHDLAHLGGTLIFTLLNERETRKKKSSFLRISCVQGLTHQSLFLALRMKDFSNKSWMIAEHVWSLHECNVE